MSTDDQSEKRENPLVDGRSELANLAHTGYLLKDHTDLEFGVRKILGQILERRPDPFKALEDIEQIYNDTPNPERSARDLVFGMATSYLLDRALNNQDKDHRYTPQQIRARLESMEENQKLSELHHINVVGTLDSLQNR